MKKPYQIESQRAVKRLEEMAADGNPAVQMVLPMAEMVGWLRKGVGALIRQAGLQLMELLMEEEVRDLVGERSQPQPDRTANRWGKERGYCVVMGQKVPIDRPRVRTTDEKEVRLGAYEMFHRGEPLTETVWEKLMLGLSTRKYGQAVRQFAEAYGLEKSAISEHFIEASRTKLKEMMERRLDKTRLCALLIDATPFAGQQMVAALGVGEHDFPAVHPLWQHRIWQEVDALGPGAADRAIARLRARDPSFNLDRASWTNDRSWVAGYAEVMDPVLRLSARFHAHWDAAGQAALDSPAYRRSLLYLLLSQTSCFRYWGKGYWTDVAQEICRRGLESLDAAT